MMNMQSLFDYGVRVNSVLVPWLVQQRLVRECKNLAKTGFRFRDNQDSWHLLLLVGQPSPSGHCHSWMVRHRDYGRPLAAAHDE